MIRRLRLRLPLRGEHGVTLIEMIMVLAILGTVLGGVTTVFVAGSRAELQVNNRFQAQEAARLAMGAVRTDVHSACAVAVSGGNTANMLAIWKVHGIDVLMREAWEQGVILWGASAGMICWFEHGVTDSFGPQLGAMDCLGFLPGSACPHYDGEVERRPRYRELIEAGLAGGIAADDGVAVHYVGTEISEIVTCRAGTAAYRVTRGGEDRLATRELS